MKIPDKLYKFLRITFLILAIVSLTFTIFYKVGHCEEPSSLGASSGGSANDSYYTFATPLPVQPEVGTDVLSSVIIDSIVDDLENGNYAGYPYNEHGFGVGEINCILFREFNSSGNYVTLYAYKDLYIDSFTFPSDFTSNSNLCTFKSLNNYFLTFDYDFDTNSITYVASRNGSSSIPFYALGSNLCYIYTAFSDPILNIDIYGIKTNFNILDYPIYLRDGSLSFSGDVIFSSSVGPSGGESDNQDIIDNIDGSDDLPQVDDSDPADTSNIPSWLKKILSALKSINSNIRGIGVTIVNLLKDLVNKVGEIIDKIGDFFVNFWQNMKNFFKHGNDDSWDDWKDNDSSDLVSALDNSLVFGGFSDFKTLVSDIDSCFDVDPVSNVPSWEIPLQGTVLYSNNLQSITIDFSFFNDFKNTWLLFIRAVVCIAFALHVIHQIPSILHGLPGNHDIDNITRTSEPSQPPVFNTFVSGDLVKNYNSKRR